MYSKRLAIFLPPSPSGPGMIKSPPLDIANLIALLRVKPGCNIKLVDFRIHTIRQDDFWQKYRSQLNIFNDFRRCFNHLLHKNDAVISRFSQAILKKAGMRNFDAAIFSVSVLEQFSLQYLVVSLCIAKELKKISKDIKIVFFGNCPKAHVRKIMGKFVFIDAFLEDGNECSLLAYLDKGERDTPIEGVCFRDKGRLMVTEKKRAMQMEGYPLPDFSLFNLDAYRANGKLVLPYEISRGCINRCFFCYYIHKGTVNHKSVEKVVREMGLLRKQYSTDYFHFMDAAINFDSSYLSRLCATFIKHLTGLKWSGLAIPNLSRVLLKRLKDAGCMQLRWGVEYGSQRMLKFINKGTDLKVIERVLKDAHEAGIYNYITLLTGIAHETAQDINKTKGFIKRTSKYIDSAKECVYGELGHFSIKRLEELFENQEIIDKKFLPQERYVSLLKKFKIPSADIIDVMTAVPKASFLVAPDDNFLKSFQIEDDGRAIPSIISSVSYLREEEICKSSYYNISELFNNKSAIKDYLKRKPGVSSDAKANFLRKIADKLVKDSTYFIFYVMWWNKNLKNSIILAESMKEKYPLAKIIFMGPYCSLYYKEIMSAYSFIDFIVRMEPEDALARVISGRGHFEDIPNLVHRNNGIDLCVHKESTFDLAGRNFSIDYLPLVEFNVRHGLGNPIFVDYEISRGCRYSCFFCSDCFTSRKLRYKKISFVTQEIKSLVRTSGLNNIYFFDNALNEDKEYLENFVNMILKEKIEMKWSCYMIAKELDTDLINKLAQAGCKHIRWGIESIAPAMRKNIAKRINPTELSQILKMADKCGIHNQVSFITGLPYQSSFDIELDMQFLNQNQSYIRCANAYIFKPRRGTLIYRNPGQYGIKILHSLDNGKKDLVPFDEIRGLRWENKRVDQLSQQKLLSAKIKQSGFVDMDPRRYFFNLLIKGKKEQ